MVLLTALAILGQPSTLARPLAATGAVRAIDEVRVPAELPGVVRKLHVRRGDVVAAGQPLAELDDRLAKLDAALKRKAAENRAPLEATEAQAKVAEKELARDLELRGSGTISEGELDIRKSQAEAARAKVADEVAKLAQARDELARAEQLLALHVLRAPTAGTVLDAPKHEGEAVQQHETVFHLVRLDRVRVEAEVDARAVRRLKVGQPADVYPHLDEAPLLDAPTTTSVQALAWTAFGLACGGADGSLWLLDPATGATQPFASVTDRGIQCLALVPGKGDVLAAGSADGQVRWWNLRTRQLERPAFALGTGDAAATALAFAPGRMFVGREDGGIAVLELPAGTVKETLRGHRHRVSALAAAQDGGVLLSAGADEAVRRWDLRAGTATSYGGRRAAPDKAVLRLGMEAGGSFLFNVGPLLQVRRASDGAPLETLLHPARAFAFAAAFTPEPALLLAGQDDGQVQLWRRATPTAPARSARRYAGHGRGAAVHDLAIAPDGTRFATAGTGGVLVWPLPALAALDGERLPGRVSWISPQLEVGGGERRRFHVEVENRGLLLQPHGGAALFVRPGP